MPILSFSMRSQEIDKPASETDTIATKTIKLNETYKMKYLKLLHIYHNLDYAEIHDPSDSAQASNTILFARFSFLSGKQSIFYEFKDNELIPHPGMVCLGETIKTQHETTFRDAYKVLHSKGVLYINEPFTIQLYQLRSIEPSADNTDIATYNALNSHTISPITCSEFRGALNGVGQFVSFIFEYDEDDTK